MILGFHTGSLLLHDEITAITEIAKIGFSSVAIRQRKGECDPEHPRFTERCLAISHACAQHNLDLIIDTDGKFTPDPNSIWGPSLSSPDADEANSRIKLIGSWLEIAPELKCRVVTFTSGKVPHPICEADLERLAIRIELLLKKADNVKLALQPRAGDVVSTVAQFERLKQWLTDDTKLCLAADVGEMLKGGEIPIGDRLSRNLADLACVYLCEPQSDGLTDRRIGQGELDFARVALALQRCGYSRPLIARADGHSEYGLALPREAHAVLNPAQAG